MCVSKWVSLSQKTSWTLCRSQSSTDLCQTCHHGMYPNRCDYLIVLVEIRNTYVRQTGNEVNFYHCYFGKIRLTSNISKMVRDTMMVWMEVEQETANRLSIGTVTFDLGWPWTVPDLGRSILASIISNMVSWYMGWNGNSNEQIHVP